jgi:hypothetical protein
VIDETSGASANHPLSQRAWDFTLLVATVAILGALGVLSLGGTLWTWAAQRADPSWAQTSEAGFIAAMNALAGPLVIALVVVMGLCVPKRLFARRALIAVSAAMAAVGVAVALATGSVATGLAVYLLEAGGIQVAVVVMTIAGAGSLAYMGAGRWTRVGSGLLHLGFIVFGYVVVALQGSAWVLPVFGIASALLLGGSALAFYSGGGRGSGA